MPIWFYEGTKAFHTQMERVIDIGRLVPFADAQSPNPENYPDIADFPPRSVIINVAMKQGDVSHRILMPLKPIGNLAYEVIEPIFNPPEGGRGYWRMHMDLSFTNSPVDRFVYRIFHSQPVEGVYNESEITGTFLWDSGEGFSIDFTLLIPDIDETPGVFKANYFYVYGDAYYAGNLIAGDIYVGYGGVGISWGT